MPRTLALSLLLLALAACGPGGQATAPTTPDGTEGVTPGDTSPPAAPSEGGGAPTAPDPVAEAPASPATPEAERPWLVLTLPEPDPGPLPVLADDPAPVVPEEALPYDPVLSGVRVEEKPCQGGWCWWNYPRGFEVGEAWQSDVGLVTEVELMLNDQQMHEGLVLSSPLGWTARPLAPVTDAGYAHWVPPLAEAGAWRPSGGVQRYDGTSWNPLDLPELSGLDWRAEELLSPRIVTTWSADYDHGAAAVGGYRNVEELVRARLLLTYDAGDWRGQVIDDEGPPVRFSGSGPDDLWASDFWDTPSADGGSLWRFDGKRWWAEPSWLTGYLHVAARGDVWVGKHHLSRGAWTEVADAPERILWSDGARDVWGVRGPVDALVHWNGERWTPHAYLSGRLALLGAAPGGETWALALTEQGGSVLVRWNGTAWRAVEGSRLDEDLFPVEPLVSETLKTRVPSTSSSADDVWIGSDDGVHQWDGRRWTFHPLPGLRSPAEWSNHRAVTLAGTGPDDVWAVSTDAYHWDGQSWTELPALPGEVHALWSPRRGLVFALGFVVTPAGGRAEDLAERIWRFDGKQWVVELVGATLAAFVVGPRGSYVREVGAMWGPSPDDGWASLLTGHHWDGTRWTGVEVSGAEPGPLAFALCVWGAATDDVWAFTGYGYPATTGRTYHWDGASWSEADRPRPAHCGAGEWRAGVRGGLWRRADAP